MRYRKSVFVVTYARINGKIKYILLKRKLHWKGWEFPKGGVGRFEFRIFAVRRELREETGLTPLKIKSFKEKGKYLYENKIPDRAGNIGQDYKLYSAEVEFSKKIKFDKNEHSGFLWVNFNEAIKKLTWPNQKKCLRIVNELLKKKK